MRLENQSAIVQEEREATGIEHVGKLHDVGRLVNERSRHESSWNVGWIGNVGDPAVTAKFLPPVLLTAVYVPEKRCRSLAPSTLPRRLARTM
jgi:hypothetical protein